MATIPRIRPLPYSVVVLAVAVALLLSMLLWWLVARYLFIFFWPAVVISTWYAGQKGGLLAIFLTSSTIFVVFQTGLLQFPPEAVDLVGQAIFIALAVLVTRFVAQRKTREDTLRESERRFRLMVDSVPGCVWTAQPDGSIDFANKYWHEFTGLSDKQTAGLAWSSVLHPDDLENTVEAWLKAARAGKPYELAARNRRVDGQWRWLLNRAVPIFDQSGDITEWFGTSMDITELKQTQDALARERELLQKLIDTIPVMIVMYNPETAIIKLNPEFERVTGWTNEDAHGISLMEELYPDPAYREEVNGFMASLQPGWRDIMMRTRDGRIMQSSWANIKLMDDTQVGVGIDITERARLYEAEQNARKAAEAANALKTRFLAMVSHELRTPLTTIKGFATTLLATDVHWDETQSREFVQLIDQEADRLTEMIEQLLDLSRIQAGTLRIAPLPVEIPLLAHECRLRLESIRNDRELIYEIPPDLPLVSADKERVIQVMCNLVENALKFSPASTSVLIQFARNDPFVRFAVADQGIGIPPEEHERIFEPFVQVERKEKAKGTGLGLAICKGLVEAHGGRIWIDGNEQTGTIVSFTLPIVT